MYQLLINLNDDNQLYLECFDDETCKKISERDAWVAMLDVRYRGNGNFAAIICNLFLNNKEARSIYDVIFDLSKQFVQSLTETQKNTLTNAHAYGRQQNNRVIVCAEKEVLIYHFAERIAYRFYDAGKFIHLSKDENLT